MQPWILADHTNPLPAVTLNANRHVTGVMRGFDQFMNIVLDNAIDERMKSDIGMVVSPVPPCGCPTHGAAKRGAGLWAWAPWHSRHAVLCILQVVRGNSIVTIEALEKIV